jgi:hypothetical protein
MFNEYTDPDDAAVLGVAALDDLVRHLLKCCAGAAPEDFLDRVADEATPLVEHAVERALGDSRFRASLRIGDPAIAMRRWVQHWIAPWLAARFPALQPYLANAPAASSYSRTQRATSGSSGYRMMASRPLAPRPNSAFIRGLL